MLQSGLALLLDGLSDSNELGEINLKMTSTQIIECSSISGQTVKLPKEKFVFRPTVYGIILNKEKVLIARTRKGQIILPGGAVEIGETIENALKRELFEEAGIEIKVDNFFCIKEGFLYNDIKDIAYHKICFYYKCTPLSFQLVNRPNEEVSTEWVELKKVKNSTDQMGEITKQIFPLI